MDPFGLLAVAEDTRPAGRAFRMSIYGVVAVVVCYCELSRLARLVLVWAARESGSRWPMSCQSSLAGVCCFGLRLLTQQAVVTSRACLFLWVSLCLCFCDSVSVCLHWRFRSGSKVSDQIRCWDDVDTELLLGCSRQSGWLTGNRRECCQRDCNCSGSSAMPKERALKLEGAESSAPERADRASSHH